MKRTQIFILLLFSVLRVSAISHVALHTSNVGNEGKDESERSVVVPVDAYLEGNTITITFSTETSSSYTVEDSSTGLTVCSGSFNDATEVYFVLPNNIESGTYTLRVFAFDCWWYGEFDYAAE